MRWLIQLFRKSEEREDRMITSVPYRQDPAVIEEHTRVYQSEKLAALEAQVERLARLRRLGYDFDVTTRRDSDAPH